MKNRIKNLMPKPKISIGFTLNVTVGGKRMVFDNFIPKGRDFYIPLTHKNGRIDYTVVPLYEVSMAIWRKCISEISECFKD